MCWHLHGRCRRTCAWVVLWCKYLQCCCNDDLHWQHRIAPHQARSASGCARAACSSAVPETLRLIHAREAAVPCECRARRCGRVCASGKRVLHRAKSRKKFNVKVYTCMGRRPISKCAEIPKCTPREVFKVALGPFCNRGRRTHLRVAALPAASRASICSFASSPLDAALSGAAAAAHG